MKTISRLHRLLTLKEGGKRKINGTRSETRGSTQLICWVQKYIIVGLGRAFNSKMKTAKNSENSVMYNQNFVQIYAADAKRGKVYASESRLAQWIGLVISDWMIK